MDSTVFQIITLVVGFSLLVFGGDWLVKAAVSLSLRFKVKPAVIALTVIAFGTSAPELVTSSLASLKGASDAALANVVGSNIFNALAVLGLSGLLTKNTVDKHSYSKELPFLIFISILVLIMGLGGTYNRIEGAALVLLLVFFWSYSIRKAKQEGFNPSDEEEEISSLESFPKEIFFLLSGFAALAYGAHLSLNAALNIGQSLGISERILGITVLSVGTGLPELITSVIAARKGHSDIAVGNVVGSNILNLLGVLGVTVSMAPLQVAIASIQSDFYIMIAATFLIVLLMKKDGEHRYALSRQKAMILVGSYAAYLIYLLF